MLTIEGLLTVLGYTFTVFALGYSDSANLLFMWVHNIIFSEMPSKKH